MRVAVIGSRNFPDLYLVARYCYDLPPGDIIITGGARGVDALAEEIAIARGTIGYEVYLPDYARYGPRAPLVRNQWIVDRAEMVAAFWDGYSRGTMHAVRLARAAKKRVVLVTAYPRCSWPKVSAPKGL